MIVSISTLTYDLDGFVLINALESSTFGDITRRSSIVKTLDGGVAVNDGGSSHGDRSLNIVWRTKGDGHEENMERLVGSYTRLYLSSKYGYFEAAPMSYIAQGGNSTLTLNVVSKIA